MTIMEIFCCVLNAVSTTLCTIAIHISKNHNYNMNKQEVVMGRGEISYDINMSDKMIYLI